MQPGSAISGDGTSISAILHAVDLARASRPGVALALATLVNVEGSSYRQPGARLLVDAEQRVLAGAISGGCLEGDVAARAAHVCESGESVLLRYDLREDLETIWGFGAACDGIAHILLEPLADDGWLRRAHEAMLQRDQPVLVTEFGGHVATRGHHTLVENSDTARNATHVALALQMRQPTVATSEDGRSHVLVEPLDAPVLLYVIGAGRSAEAFATIAVAMGWIVTVVDHRELLLSELQLPPAAQRRLRRADQGLSDLPVDERTVVAILTHIFEIDSAWLEHLLPQRVAYIGVLGSRSRALRLLTQLDNQGLTITADMQRRLFAPIGLDLGGETPESIALAGIAEMEAVLHERPGGFLRSRESPIHTRSPTPIVFEQLVEATVDKCAMSTEADD